MKLQGNSAKLVKNLAKHFNMHIEMYDVASYLYELTENSNLVKTITRLVGETNHSLEKSDIIIISDTISSLISSISGDLRHVFGPYHFYEVSRRNVIATLVIIGEGGHSGNEILKEFNVMYNTMSRDIDSKMSNMVDEL